MFKSMVILMFLSLCVGFGAWLFYLFAVNRGDFDDPEGPKYRMMHDDDDIDDKKCADTSDEEIK